MAASSTAVTVLTPNGRRQTVKVSPNTPLLQVLEDVCKKHGFNPDDHGLKFQRNVLDLTLPWRFASVPNNAKLEMVPSTRKQAGVDSQVRIALQMEDGSRLQGSFSCGQNLWELLTHFPQTGVLELSESGSTPVCVYMRDEVTGEEALKNATLKSLGLTGGSAIVRFLLKKSKTPEEEDGSEAMETVVTPITPVAKESPPSPPSRRDVAPPEPETSAEVPIKASGHDKPAEAPTPASAPGARPAQQEAVPAPQDVVRPKVCPVRGGMQEEDGEEAGPSGLNSCHTSSSSSSAPFIPFSGGGQRLGGPGGGGAGSSVSSSSSSSSLSTMAALGGSPKAKKAKPSNGVNAKSKASAKQQDEAVGQVEEFLEPVDREPLVYHLDSESHYSQDNQDLPDEFFEVTVDDVRKRFAQLKSERRLLEEAPLMTKALRETQMKEKMDRYPKVVLRVQFPDRHVLQGFFRPLETVAAVRHFVRSHLENPELSFYLFIAPPRTVLNDPSATLFQANLFPGALVYFGSDVKTDCFLQKQLIDSCVSAMQANESIASCMPRSPAAPSSGTPHLSEPPPPAEPAGNSGTSGEHDEDPAAHSQAPRPAQPDLGKVPKWLKLPGKK
ncbi:tether containing UBX domain for GLUT4 [Myripristis murdjan]|uniref:tether containing UBX domain for GLUT4 n=1 Tax=Myripristis murdjan TaxID=586833 RepID=UPI0011762DF6|nr:tether containing UBX domain for GLUT4 [Myripristis murdjan]